MIPSAAASSVIGVYTGFSQYFNQRVHKRLPAYQLIVPGLVHTLETRPFSSSSGVRSVRIV